VSTNNSTYLTCHTLLAAAGRQRSLGIDAVARRG
jgi:hypothetical protein